MQVLKMSLIQQSMDMESTAVGSINQTYKSFLKGCVTFNVTGASQCFVQSMPIPDGGHQV